MFRIFNITKSKNCIKQQEKYKICCNELIVSRIYIFNLLKFVFK